MSIDGAIGWLDCVLEAEHWAGDHVIVLCRVSALDLSDDGQPLVFYRGGYGGFRGARRLDGEIRDCAWTYRERP